MQKFKVLADQLVLEDTSQVAKDAVVELDPASDFAKNALEQGAIEIVPVAKSSYQVLNPEGISVEGEGDIVHKQYEVVDIDPESDQTKHFVEGAFIEPAIQHVITQDDIDFEGLVAEGFVVGDTVLMAQSVIDAATKAGDEKRAAALAEAEPAPAAEEVVAVPKKYFQKKLIVSEGKRVVGDKTYHTLTLEDGSNCDVTPEEYGTIITE